MFCWPCVECVVGVSYVPQVINYLYSQVRNLKRGWTIIYCPNSCFDDVYMMRSSKKYVTARSKKQSNEKKIGIMIKWHRKSAKNDAKLPKLIQNKRKLSCVFFLAAGVLIILLQHLYIITSRARKMGQSVYVALKCFPLFFHEQYFFFRVQHSLLSICIA